MGRLFLVFILLGTGTLMMQAQGWSDIQLQKMYVNYLDDLGYNPKIDGDGDVQFMYNDRRYFIEVNESDNEFFRVVLANIWSLESLGERGRAMEACDKVNGNMKCTKAYIVNDNIWIAVELFVDSPDDFKPVFLRCLTVIEKGVSTFVDEM